MNNIKKKESIQHKGKSRLDPWKRWNFPPNLHIATKTTFIERRVLQMFVEYRWYLSVKCAIREQIFVWNHVNKMGMVM